MQRSTKRKRVLYFGLLPILLAVFGAYILTAFEYTAIAELRENFTEVDQQDTVAYGALLFETRGCAGCHAVDPGVKSLGPNLSRLATRGTKEYIRTSIMDPGAVIVDGYSNILMPDFGSILDNAQLDALVSYLLTFD